jgi:phosphotransferase system IIA component
VVAAFPTGHAYGIQTDAGLEGLVHIGVDTVKLKGAHFAPLVCAGQRLRLGQPLAGVDFEAVARAGHDTSVIVVVTNTAEFAVVEPVAAGTPVQMGDAVVTVRL